MLTGVIAAFLAKGLEARSRRRRARPRSSAPRRLVDHGAGLVASDVIDALPAALDAQV